MPEAPKRTAAGILANINRRGNELGEDLLMPFYNFIEMRTRQDNRGHTDPVTPGEHDWDRRMTEFRKRQYHEKYGKKDFQRRDAEAEEGGQ